MASALNTYTVRPLTKPARADLKDAFRIYLSPSALLFLKLKAGDACSIWKEASPQRRTAIAWPALEKLQEHVVQTSKPLQKAYQLNLGDKVHIRKADRGIDAIGTIYLEEVEAAHSHRDDKHPREKEYWEWLLGDPLDRAELLAVGLLIENVEHRGRKRAFCVQRIVNAAGETDFGRFVEDSRVEIVPAAAAAAAAGGKTVKLPEDSIHGLAPQVRAINSVLEAFSSAAPPVPLLARPGGILLHGPSGTGKSMLLKRIAALSWGAHFWLDAGTLSAETGAPKLHALFAAAAAAAAAGHRAVVLIDNLETVAFKRGRNDITPSLANALQAELDALAGDTTSDAHPAAARPSAAAVLVVAATNALNDIDNRLRRPSCFAFEIEIPIPNSAARTEFIKSIVGVPASDGAAATADSLLEDFGQRTHGYTRSDVYAAVFMAAWIAEQQRPKAASSDSRGDETDAAAAVSAVSAPACSSPMATQDGLDGHSRGASPSPSHGLTRESIEQALLCVRPSAIRELILEVPKVRWSDIGGQEHVKQVLRETLESQLKNPARMERLGAEPRKGLLLYGPPGCSKTMMAKALATESGLNFIAVRGAELLNMYVGESERALRAVFSKARAASPSIIFFDEIDAIAGTRSPSGTDSGGGGGGGGGGGANGLNVLTTLLNEMDGIEALRGVTVLAATNQPELLDAALLRPGRLDAVLYVGPPDEAAREAILRLRTARMDTAPDVDVAALARRTPGLSGAELVGVCNTAAYAAFAASDAAGAELPVSHAHFEAAAARVRRRITPAVLARYERWAAGGDAGVQPL